jgi:hypothetical protein
LSTIESNRRAASLLPQAFWFRLAIPCPRIEGLPRTKGRLLDLPDDCILPKPEEWDGRKPWAEVRAAWNPQGLALAFEVKGKLGPLFYDPDHPEASDGVEIRIDTRDTRDIHRASRYCHRFGIAILDKGTGALVQQKKIHRALADAPLCRPDTILTRLDLIKNGWRIELFFPAEALHGFDPETNQRLGFCFRVTDPDRGDQSLGLGREFPVGEDPSLWATLELKDESPARLSP